MKLVIFLLLVSIATLSNSQDISTMTPEQAKDFIGKKVTVCGEVKGTHVTKGKVNFLRFGSDYPNQVFSVIIYANDAIKFKETPANVYAGKTICVTGVINLYEGKPEMEIDTESQVKIQEE